MSVEEISLLCPFQWVLLYVSRGNFPALFVLEDFCCMSIEEISLLCLFLRIFAFRGGTLGSFFENQKNNPFHHVLKEILFPITWALTLNTYTDMCI